MKPSVGIPVNDLLKLDELQNCRVVGGRSGLQRLVTNVNVMEVPDVFPWVNPGELLLTTAYAIINDPEAQRMLVPALAERGLAGLGIKTKRYMDNIPVEMTHQAEEYHFPLIELSPDTSHPKLIKAILGEILNRQAVILDRVIQVHEQLVEVTARGGDLSSIARALAGLIQNPVGIWDAAGALMELAPGPVSPELASQLAESDTPGHEDWEVGSRFRVDEVPFDGEKVSRVAVPVAAADRLHGYIVAWGMQWPPDSDDIAVLERSIGLVATQFLTRQMLMGVERRYCNEFLYDWLGGEIVDDKTITQRGRTLGWDLTRPYVILLIGLRGARGSPRPPTIQESVFNWLTHYIHTVNSAAIVGERGSQLIVFVPTGGGKNPQTKAFVEFAARLRQSCMARFANLEVQVGIGRPFIQPAGAITSYAEARKAFELCDTLRPEHGVLHYDDLGVYKLLHHVTDPQEVDRFLAETVQPLVEYDRKNNTDLLHTLEVYLECGSLRRMTEVLFAHYNTILYRMERIRKLLPLDLDNPKHRLTLDMGLKLLKLQRRSGVTDG